MMSFDEYESLKVEKDLSVYLIENGYKKYDDHIYSDGYYAKKADTTKNCFINEKPPLLVIKIHRHQDWRSGEISIIGGAREYQSTRDGESYSSSDSVKLMYYGIHIERLLLVGNLGYFEDRLVKAWEAVHGGMDQLDS